MARFDSSVGGAITAPVEGDVEADVVLVERGAICAQRAVDSRFFVMCGNDDVERHVNLTSSVQFGGICVHDEHSGAADDASGSTVPVQVTG